MHVTMKTKRMVNSKVVFIELFIEQYHAQYVITHLLQSIN